MYISLHVKRLLFLSDFNETSIFSTDIKKNTKILNIIKIRPARAELFHADGRTDSHDEANSRFSQVCERAQKNCQFSLYPDRDGNIRILVHYHLIQHSGPWIRFNNASRFPSYYNFLIKKKSKSTTKSQ